MSRCRVAVLAERIGQAGLLMALLVIVIMTSRNGMTGADEGAQEDADET